VHDSATRNNGPAIEIPAVAAGFQSQRATFWIKSMLKMKSNLVLLMIVALSLAACSKEPDQASGSALSSSEGLLKYVPADTPYLLAMPVALPDDVLDKLEPQADVTLRMYPALIKGILTSMITAKEAEGEETGDLGDALPFVDELGSLLSVEGLREAGIDRDSRFVMYGAGMLPVIRTTLSDGKILEAAFARLEESAAKKMSVASIGKYDYRFAGNDEGRVIIAIMGNELVISLVPAALSEEQLKAVLGLTLPDENIAQRQSLQNIADRYGFEDYVVGFIDIERIASVFIDDQSGVNAELKSIMKYDDALMTDACKADLRSIAGVMPRVVVGYTDISIEKLSSKAVFELRQDLATGISAMTGSVPGLGSDQGGIFSIGMSTDLMAAREFYAGRLDAMEADPYDCEEFSDLQAGVAAGREVLNQPVPPIVYGFKGFLAVIEDIEGLDLKNEIPPTSIDMRLLVSMDNVEGLLAMGAMFSPELAALNIEPNGEPVKLEMGQIAAMGQTVHIAMTDAAIAVSVGEGTEDRLKDMLAAGVNVPSPFMTFEMDAARYYSFIGDAMLADGGANMDSMPELMEAAQAMMDMAQETLSRLAITVDFTEHGIELNSTVHLTQ